MNADPTSLERLHDVIAPAPVAWWPPAPGWYWVLSALAVLLLVALVWSFLHWQRNRYRREALAELRRHESRLGDAGQRAAALAGMAELLKRTALSAFPRDQVAALTGSAWLIFLDQTASMTGFYSGPGVLLEGAAYDPRSVAAVEQSHAAEAASLVRHWVKHHRVGGVS